MASSLNPFFSLAIYFSLFSIQVFLFRHLATFYFPVKLTIPQKGVQAKEKKNDSEPWIIPLERGLIDTFIFTMDHLNDNPL